MAAELIIAPEAQQDTDAAYSWYEDRRSGLGEEFLACVDACIQAICRTPELHAKVHEEYRRSLVRRFPYAIFYEYTGGKVIVYSIFHASRDPKKWRNRLV
ncbi:MAG: type II toxin-antitoxin system RelE/ParE family toxin [Pseudomonadota bacterium]|uniref:Type II toxin-antitoxin system RelE/ParE family toxin n=1 Tax=Candidatus Desulfatibia profunda TaxID=2841695 RepID=A0A8J6TLL2_9BACT|nr:type II toxin-antitoxin system RelE/ParE family toxin [Candidatus Desulfatibia profunda]MBL7180040.1 type II toxin-antitoxin system RelE/ParE family toxin [Desulfobacterales bacterium]